MPANLKQRAKRALVTLLLALAGAYGLQVTLTRESTDVEVTRVFRRVSIKVHPDKGGAAADAQRLNAARDAWVQASQGTKPPGRPAHAQAGPVSASSAVTNGREGLRIRSEAVLLTYQSWPAGEAPGAWQRFCVFVAASVTAWTVKHWAATMEQTSGGDCHLHLMVQFTSAVDCGSARFIFEGVRPNASPNDYLGEGVCRKKLQQSINRGMFYVWADKVGTLRLPSGETCVAANYEPCWTEARRTYQVLGKWPEALWKQRKLTSAKYEQYLFLTRDGVLARKRNLDAVREHEAALADAALIEATTKRLRANPEVYRAFPAVPAAEAWLATFREDRLRYPLLIVHGPSQTGKTEWVKSLFKRALELKVGSLDIFPEGMRAFDRDTHDGIILDDVRDLKFIAEHQDKLQGKYDTRVEFATTPGGTCAYRKYLFAVPVAVTINNSTRNLDFLRAHDWLGSERNRVLVHFPDILASLRHEPASTVAQKEAARVPESQATSCDTRSWVGMAVRPVVPHALTMQEVRHPRSLNFATERQVVVLREVHGCAWEDIRSRVRNLRGERPSLSLLKRVYKGFSQAKGRRPYKYQNCGRRPVKATKAVQKFLVQRLLALRMHCVCTSGTLQRELLAKRGVQLDESAIRKALRRQGYFWLPKAQKRKYSAERRQERLRFARSVVQLSRARLREKLSFSMDGVLLSLPPRDPTDRRNYCAHGDGYMWRQRGEAGMERLAGQNPYLSQVPRARAVPLWGGLSEGGFRTVAFHKARKFTAEEWHAMAAKNITLWPVPASSPDLNPVEKFWAWLRRRLRHLDREDLRRKRPPIGMLPSRRFTRTVHATRALVTLLLALAGAYGLQVTLTRESTDVEVTRVFRRVSIKVHPDKGGAAADAQRLNAARDAWVQASQGTKPPGRPAHAQAGPVSASSAVTNGREGLRIRSEAVLLTYQSWPAGEAPGAWQRFCVFVAASVTAWTVKHWAATMEQTSGGDCHLHLMVQFTSAVDCGSARFIFEGVRPNASPNDYLGEGVCRNKLQQSINRGMFYVWADKVGTLRLPSGETCVAANYEPCWTEARRTYQVLGKWPEALWKQRKLTSAKYEQYLFLTRDGVLARKRNLDAVREHEAALADAALIEATTKRLRANPEVYRAFPAVPAAEAWLATFREDRLRYPLLIVHGPSQTGKTEWVKSLFKRALELKVGSLDIFPEGMRAFDRDTHDGIILDDVRDLKFIAEHQDKLQGKYDTRVEFATTPGGTCAYRKYPFAVPVAVTINNSTRNLDFLRAHDWLGSERNRVLVHFPDILAQ
ncbi:unnamed protein product, partial [Symbiodinium natans]